MKRQISGALVQTLLCLLLAVPVSGCGQKDSGSAAPPSTAATAATPVVAAPEIAGEYTVKGTNPGADDYTGSLTVTKRNDVYQFSWTAGASSYDGVGVRTDNSVGVAFASGSNGKSCSVVHYKVGDNGALVGRWGQWGSNASGGETAARAAAGSGLPGKYDVTGTRLDGQPYKGTLEVAAQGAGFLFNWSTGDTAEGFGIRMGSFVSVGIGGGECGFAAYEVKPDGSLSGQWSSFKSKTVGTEVATRKK